MMARWPYAFGMPEAQGYVKSIPEDFIVEEILGFDLSGEGEHLFLWVEKTNENTETVARQLADLAGIPRRQISYAGLKDRQAVTRQWFSLHLPGKKNPDWRLWGNFGFSVLKAVRHHRKLKKGALTGNRFRLRVRDITGDCDGVEARICQLAELGIPNYFGSQRFGYEGENVKHATAWFQGELTVKSRHLQGIYLSAARAWLFNQVLAARISKQAWNQPLNGDLLMFDGSGAFFRAEKLDEAIGTRVRQQHLHPSGPLWGVGDDKASHEAGEIELQAIKEYPQLAQGLEKYRVKLSRRPLRARLQDFEWEWRDKDLQLSFSLPSGSYATAVLRELVLVN
ncbi:MAG: hypothetical protein AXA67_11640 [Methylothermaceae bacteria B42]|nr:MAG: hypothetical protein AXA67_11640 [Methylothermaceae bacteria B42]HHJ39184.1 tRNA pseudouridine(13) synthase TruD [Methylothermaceae bacterium]